MRSTLSARHFGSTKTLNALVIGTRVLSGCASFAPDGGFDTVRETTRARIGADAQWARSDEARKEIDTRVTELLAKPLHFLSTGLEPSITGTVTFNVSATDGHLTLTPTVAATLVNLTISPVNDPSRSISI